jgi:uncharacterized protein (TIGR03437 family)
MSISPRSLRAASISLCVMLAAIATASGAKSRISRRAPVDTVASSRLLAKPRATTTTSSYTLFESGPVRPLALSADGTLLYAVNTPANRLEIFSISGAAAQTVSQVASVPVGLEPVAVALRTPTEVWVVNHLSDSVSILDVSSLQTARVVQTLLVGDEPRDIVFAGPSHDRAFITTAHRGQNSPIDPQLTTPGVGRADVWVFDATNLGATLGGVPLTIITLFADTPRALAVTPDGNTVYAAAFRSGNGTTTISAGSIPPNGAPPPHTNYQGVPAPATGLIVKYRLSASDGKMHWQDEANTVWDSAVNLSLPDEDVFVINAAANPPVQQTGASGFFTGVGTVLFNMVVNPVSGTVYVSNTDAQNDQRFEGPGTYAGHSLRGHLAESHITVLSGGQVLPRHLNKHINYSSCCAASPNAESVKSLAFPTDMAISSDGQTLYVAAFGSSKIGIFNTAALENDSFVPSTANQVTVSGGGPGGLALDQTRHLLYVLTRFDNSISIVNLQSQQETAHLAMLNPEPASVLTGRHFLYDATTSSHGDSACASCHIFGDFDGLAWDLGDPDDAPVNDPGPFAVLVGPATPFNPMKGPMTVQSLRGMANHGPMHWRGDRTGGNDAASAQPDSGSFNEVAGFMKFNPAFQDLLGSAAQLSTADMQAFADFVLQITYPPNPIRNLDNSLTSDQLAGQNFFLGLTNNGLPSDTLKTCTGCHVLDPNGNSQYGVARPGFFGTDGQSSFENETQLFKIPQLRNLYQKVGKFGMSPDPLFPSDATPFMGPQVRGFGFLHDGSIDTLFRFHGAKVFEQSLINPGGIPTGAAGDTIRNQLTAFLLAFDSNLAPIVGQQISLTQSNTAVAGPRIDLLESRAAAGECDLVAQGIVNGLASGYLYNPQQKMFSTPNPSFTISDTGLRALAQNVGDELTFTCTPPGSGASIAAQPIIGSAPVTTASGLVNAANPTPGSTIAPGSMASLYGTNLSSAKLLAGVPLPLQLAGTSMTVGNLPAPLFYVSPLQVNFQVPWISISKPTQFPIQITQGESLTTITVTLTPYAPALFTTNGQGSGQAAAIISNTSSLAAPSGAYPGSRPAKQGEFVLLYCTGLGAVTNQPAAGDVSPSNPPATTLATPTLTLGGAPVPVSFSGLAPGYVGLYQVNFQIPTNASSGNAITVVLSIGGASSNTATIAIQ